MPGVVIDPAAAAAMDLRTYNPSCTVFVIARGWFTGTRKVLSAHWGHAGPTGARPAADELVRQGFEDVEVWDGKTGTRWRP